MSGMDQKLNCLIVDDEPHAIKILELYIEKTPFLKVAAKTTSPWEAMEILKKESIDLLFLDIQMEGLTGLQLLDLAGKTCPVILTTAYAEYALEGYAYQVSDYLLKPFSFERFLKATTRIWQEQKEVVTQEEESPALSEKNKDYLFVKGDAKNKFHRVRFDDICYVEGLRNYVQFICIQDKVITLQNLKDLEESLPTDRFMRIHRSFIINLDQIIEISGNSVLIHGERLPIGNSYRAAFFEKIQK
jgi:DNA-binding LytR/AlgR family response regulator